MVVVAKLANTILKILKTSRKSNVQKMHFSLTCAAIQHRLAFSLQRKKKEYLCTIIQFKEPC